MEAETKPHNAIVARQPIFDWDLNVCAYELLFRSTATALASNLESFSADLATTRVINYAFLEIGMDRVLGDQVGFVNLTRNFLLNDDPLPFAKERVVLEVLEDIEPDDEVIAAIKQLVAQGYTIALDDFIFKEALKPLIECAEIIKVDILQLDDQQLAEHARILKQFPVKLLAEKVETNEQFQRCRDLGFDMFQGYFFSRPTIIEDASVPDNHVKLLQIIEKLQDPDVEFSEIESLICQDPGLTYKLTRLLNSASVGLHRKIDSVKQALVFLGLRAIKTWTTLIALNEIQAVPPELMTNSLVRAKMCEGIAPKYGFTPELGFILGLFSNLDAMLKRPMEKIIKNIPLDGQLKLALESRGGRLGNMLDDVINYKTGHWDQVNSDCATLDDFAECYISATEWTHLTQQVL
jgi:EAL and modified HD-GYP domain-containing signal transduction protein